ncbi:mediator complex subunit [Savitreella phatthalungensis]
MPDDDLLHHSNMEEVEAAGSPNLTTQGVNQPNGHAHERAPDHILDTAMDGSTINGAMTTGSARPEKTTAKDAKSVLPHIQDRMIPISHIVTALTRQAMRDLHTLRETMTDMVDQKRKRRLVEYVANYRAEFAKLIVLAHWARRVAEVRTAIDVRAWLQGQKNCFDNLYAVLRFDILNQMQFAKIPSADLKTALDVLTTGTLPELRTGICAGRPSEHDKTPLADDERRKIHQTIETHLTLRLALHETIPSQFASPSISEGKATFCVAREFDLDLTSTSTDVAAATYPWRFVDVRLLGPEDEEPHLDPRLKRDLKHAVDHVLFKARTAGSSQLEAAYRLVHDFVLAARFEQLIQLLTGLNGIELDLRIDVTPARNSFTVTYWSATLASHSRAPSFTVERDNQTRQLRVLGGIDRIVLPIDVFASTAKAIIQYVVAQHVRTLLTEIRDALHIKGHDARIGDTASELSLVFGAGETLQVRIEPIKGQFQVSLDNTNRDNLNKLQNELRHSPNAVGRAAVLEDFVQRRLRQSIIHAASLAGWVFKDMQDSSLPRDEFAQAGASTVGNALFFTRKTAGWFDVNGNSAWFAVALLKGATSWTWHIAETAVLNNAWKLQWLEPLGIDPITVDADGEMDSVKFYQRLMYLCTAKVIILQLQRGLAERGLMSKVSLDVDDPTKPPVALVAARDLIGPAADNWLGPLLRWRIAGLYSCSGMHLRLVFDLVEIDATSLVASGLLINDGKSYSISVPCSVETPARVLIDSMLLAWQSIYILVSMLSDTRRFAKYASATIESATTVSFEYGLSDSKKHQLLLNIATGSPGMTLVQGRSRNPHKRIEHYLAADAAIFRTNACALLGILALTEPVLVQLDAFEQLEIEKPSFYVIARSAAHYRLVYPSRNAQLDVRARINSTANQEDRVTWLVTDPTIVKPGTSTKLACKQVFERGIDPLTTTPMTHGVRCHAKAVCEVLEQCHNAVLSQQSTARPPASTGKQQSQKQKNKSR